MTLCCVLHNHLSNNVGCPESMLVSSGMLGVVSMHVLTDCAGTGLVSRLQMQEMAASASFLAL